MALDTCSRWISQVRLGKNSFADNGGGIFLLFVGLVM